MEISSNICEERLEQNAREIQDKPERSADKNKSGATEQTYE